MKKTLIKISTLAAFATPFLALAQTSGASGVFSLLATATALINQLLPFIISLTVLVFLWGILMYVTSGADTEKRAEARGYMIWGIIALFVMVSVWGLVNILAKSIPGLDNTPINAPSLPNVGGTVRTY
ncbi:MAG: hypothetical protein PHF79_00495 [Candidatus Pacebacteria bacterium]|nr:hypothetical protein [Candidatus Paceibacterota bacterium]